ncbi:alanine racemase [Paenibacillus eucommiae]|uniref:D-serine deaminase-like pyridoxal phosphate-dependent protein n=1 Tax=Paenibacillus eucommiae TaxID=1355755 RepID=A0ABS4J4J0_9BACL|nr:alanine racemase [Paenibacillus eucommiae]MBP1994016.1 D-serine deaminase-like pyridoxal phosphate-dependent protein [Paenibacillus eucommiae]
MSDIGKKLVDLETPAILIDLDTLDRNLRHTAELAQKAGVKLRPHFKTHKSVWIAKQQMKYGACGMTVAKLGEAEVLVDAGIDDILIAFPIVGKAKLERLAKLLERAKIIVSTDNVDVAKGLSDLGTSIGKKIRLYIDVNTGLNRCGKEPGEETAALVTEISKLPGVEVIGLMTHGGFAYGLKTPEDLRNAALTEAQGLVKTKELLEQSGISIPEISVGSTPTSKYVDAVEGVTEIRPGAYVYGDGGQLFIGIIKPEECAMHVMATVVGIPRKGTAIIDAGSKTFSSDASGHFPGFGRLRDQPEVYVERLSEEHGIVHLPEGVSYEIGDQLFFLPNHCCTVSNLHNELQGIRGDQVEQIITVDARGKVR